MVPKMFEPLKFDLYWFYLPFSDDPNEHNDLSKQYPDVVKELKAKLEEYKKSYVPPKKPPIDPKANPDNYDGYWSPGWC